MLEAYELQQQKIKAFAPGAEPGLLGESWFDLSPKRPKEVNLSSEIVQNLVNSRRVNCIDQLKYEIDNGINALSKND